MFLFIQTDCYGQAWCKINVWNPSVTALFYLAPLFPVFILSVITYRLDGRIFRSWVNFAFLAVPVIIAIFYKLAAQTYLGLGIEAIYARAFTALILIGLIFLFLIISISIVIWKYWRLKGKGKTEQAR